MKKQAQLTLLFIVGFSFFLKAQCPDLNLEVRPDTALFLSCTNKNVILKGTSNTTGTTYAWSNGSVNDNITVYETGDYTLIATANGCSVPKTITVTEDKTKPTVSIITQPSLGTLTCATTTVFLEAVTNNAFIKWSTNSTNATISVSTPETYTVTATHPLTGCTDMASYTVKQDLSKPENVKIITACNGTDVALVASSTTPSTTFNWDKGIQPPPNGTVGTAFATNPINLSGTYTVIVTLPATGCTTTLSKIVDIANLQPADISGNLSLCGSPSTTLTAVGGTAADAYLWSKNGVIIPNVITSFLVVTQAGFYSVRITGEGGCMGTKEVEVKGSTLSVSLGDDKPICGTGTVELKPVVTGGSATHYLWSNGKTDPTIIVGAGTYSVTVSNASNCGASDEIIVSSSTVLPTPYVGTGTFCGCGQVVAKARRQPSVAGKMFVWYDNPNRTGTPLPSTMSPEGDVSLLASTTSRTVWAFEKEGDCYSVGAQVVLTVFPIPPIAPSVSGTDIRSCGSSTVTVKPSAAGHTAELWSTANQTPGTQLVLGADGSYTTSVNQTVFAHEIQSTTCGSGDVLRCYGPATTIVLIVYPVPTVNAGADVSICTGSSTILKATVSGGVSPYTYKWSNGSLTESTTVLEAKTYTVEVTDKNSCKATDDVIVKNGAGFTFTYTKTDIKCYGDRNGTIIITPSITGNFKYSRNGGTDFQTSNIFDYLSAKPYNIVVKLVGSDCVNTQTIEIKQPEELKSTIRIKQITCNNANNGLFVVSPVGGTAPYQYKLNNGDFQADNAFINLSEGIYNIKVKDANGCTYIFENLKITNPRPLKLTFDLIEHNRCKGYSEGKIHTRASGGNGFEKYTIDNGTTFQKSPNFSGLAAGTYIVFAVDWLGCESNKETVVLKQPSGLDYTITKSDATCYDGRDGKIIISSTPTGSTSPHYYSADDGDNWQLSNTFSNLKAKTYIVRIRDDNWCLSHKQSVKIEQPSAISFKTTQTGASCLVYNDGTLKVSDIKGGSGAPYQYSKDNGATWQSDNNFTGLKPAVYRVRVKDSKGCISHICDVTIEKSSAPTFSIVIEDISCGHQANGVIGITKVKGGSSPYKYSCDGGTSYQTSNSFTTLTAGKYKIIVKDFKGCLSNTEEVTIVNKCPYKNTSYLAQVKPTQLIPVVMWKVTPNPTSDVIQVSVTSLTEREQEFVFFNMYGQPLKTEKRSLVKGEQNIIFDCTEMPSGFYQVTTTGSYSRNLIMRFLKM